MLISTGVRNMLIATFTFTVMKVMVKIIPHIPPVEIILFRSVVSLIMSFVALKIQKVDIWGNNKPILILRGLSGAMALLTFFTLLQQIPLATASLLQYLAPIFTALLGIFIVKENVNPKQWLFFAVSFVGILVVKGVDTRISYYHLFLGVSASLFMGLAYNFIRRLRTSEHPLVIIFYFPLVVIPIAGTLSFFKWVPPIGYDWVILVMIGVFTQVAQYFMTKAYQSEALSKISILNYVGLIYSLIFGYVIFDEQYDLLAYLGMALVLVGVILNVWYKRRLELRKPA
ncbi:MAG TPA: DMT family transporter [Cyclobacteriaceae bacterium]